MTDRESSPTNKSCAKSGNDSRLLMTVQDERHNAASTSSTRLAQHIRTSSDPDSAQRNRNRDLALFSRPTTRRGTPSATVSQPTGASGSGNKGVSRMLSSIQSSTPRPDEHTTWNLFMRTTPITISERSASRDTSTSQAYDADCSSSECGRSSDGEDSHQSKQETTPLPHDESQTSYASSSIRNPSRRTLHDPPRTTDHISRTITLDRRRVGQTVTFMLPREHPRRRADQIINPTETSPLLRKDITHSGDINRGSNDTIVPIDAESVGSSEDTPLWESNRNMFRWLSTSSASLDHTRRILFRQSDSSPPFRARDRGYSEEDMWSQVSNEQYTSDGYLSESWMGCSGEYDTRCGVVVFAFLVVVVLVLFVLTIWVLLNQ
ncbi:unnamed protein product [Periconia digitata]|uniref:Uncharacterized protein n=1 Tax=Periconia digitata TaxID=1303443 RepID=A0A9W4UPC3_9PLEO|nr:unnamed protein product [Periconia digitata]